MKVITVRNVNEALPQGMDYLRFNGETEKSRAGNVLVAPDPVTTQYVNPEERVLFNPLRDANPFFHLMESLWMLAGRDDVSWLSQFNSRMEQYSDDGVSFHGAYGHRWKFMTNEDQLDNIVQLLKNYPNSRRAVLQMWNAEWDLCTNEQLRDIPCNTQAYFEIKRGRLNMMVTCRSNDMIWGAYGANAVHFSILQEYLAFKLNVPIGEYWQVSRNFHAYEDVFCKLIDIADLCRDGYRTVSVCPYSDGSVMPTQIIDEHFDDDLENFFNEDFMSIKGEAFNNIILPMYYAYSAWKDKGVNRYHKAFTYLSAMPEKQDWTVVSRKWMERRYEKSL